jgi:hypothetical protein
MKPSYYVSVYTLHATAFLLTRQLRFSSARGAQLFADGLACGPGVLVTVVEV